MENQILSFKVFKHSGKWDFDLPDIEFDYNEYVDESKLVESLIDDYNISRDSYNYILITNSKYELSYIYDIKVKYGNTIPYQPLKY